jgi:hypothetical protein
MICDKISRKIQMLNEFHVREMKRDSHTEASCEKYCWREGGKERKERGGRERGRERQRQRENENSERS